MATTLTKEDLRKRQEETVSEDKTPWTIGTHINMWVHDAKKFIDKHNKRYFRVVKTNEGLFDVQMSTTFFPIWVEAKMEVAGCSGKELTGYHGRQKAEAWRDIATQREADGEFSIV